MNILLVGSEMAGLVRTGGLGDVIAALPPALKDEGHDVRVAIPAYASIPKHLLGTVECTVNVQLRGGTIQANLRKTVLPDTDFPVYLVEEDGYFGRPHPYTRDGREYLDNLDRFTFFCRALLSGLSSGDWRPDVVHCNDWHTALLPLYLATEFARSPFWTGVPTIFTIHNLAYQGCYPAHHLDRTNLPKSLFNIDVLEFHGKLNMMKGGIAYASKINAVSPTYAKEIQTPDFGAGLDGFLRTRTNDISGIVNGVDYEVWNPENDKHIAARYSPQRPDGKAQCKTALQKKLGLQVNADVPMFGMVSRLDWQKGLDILEGIVPELAKRNIQLVILGTGDPTIEKRLMAVQEPYGDWFRPVIDFDEPLSHQIIAGSDFFLMPSRYEPCGLCQLYSLAYGTIPIARRTGGLADTIVDMSARAQQGTGFLFNRAIGRDLLRAVERALALYTDKSMLKAARQAGMAQDFSWQRSAKAYVKLYEEAIKP